MHGLTDRQATILLFIRTSVTEKGYPPTLREIGAHMGIRSTNGVNDHLRALEKKGYLSRENMKSRGMRALGNVPDAAPAEDRAAVVLAGNGRAHHDALDLAAIFRGIIGDYNVMAVRKKDGSFVADFASELARRFAEAEAR